MSLTRISRAVFRYLIAPAALALLAYIAVDRHPAAQYVAKAELTQTQNRLALLEGQFVEAREKLALAQTEATRESARHMAPRSELEARDKALDIRLKSLEANVKEARDSIEAVKARAGASGDLTRILTALQTSLGVEITKDSLSREGILSIDTRIVNKTAYAVVIDFPEISVSTDAPGTALSKRTTLKPDVDYELLDDRIVTGYLPSGGDTQHNVTVRLKGNVPPQGVSYRLTYSVETDKHVREIVMKYLAGAIGDLKPSDVDLLTRKTFSWVRRVAVH